MANSQSTGEAYATAVQRASLENIFLTASTFRAKIEYKSSGPDVQRFIDSSVRGCSYDAQAKMLVGEVQCKVWIKRKPSEQGDVAASDPQEDDNLFLIDAMYTLVFKVPGEHSSDTLKAFFKRMAPFAVWPYFRTHVASTASEANMNVPVLPIKKLVQSVETATSYMEPQELDVPQIGSE